MRNTRNILIGVLSALITFGALTLSFGSRHHSWHRGHHFGPHANHAGDSCRWEGEWRSNEQRQGEQLRV